MATMMSSGMDVVTFLKEQHEQIKLLFTQVLSTTGKERESQFFALRRLLAVHETAEEQIVHPAARGLPGGDTLVEALLAQEREAKEVLSGLEALDVDSSEFETQLNQLRQAVLAHAMAEEREEFQRLATIMDPDKLQRMRRAAEFAEKVAPTRPHPGVESATANTLAGPFASMIDRTRDAFSGKAQP